MEARADTQLMRNVGCNFESILKAFSNFEIWIPDFEVQPRLKASSTYHWLRESKPRPLRMHLNKIFPFPSAGQRIPRTMLAFAGRHRSKLGSPESLVCGLVVHRLGDLARQS